MLLVTRHAGIPGVCIASTCRQLLSLLPSLGGAESFRWLEVLCRRFSHLRQHIVMPQLLVDSQVTWQMVDSQLLIVVFKIKIRTLTNFCHLSRSFASRVAGTVAGKLVKPAVVATQHDTVARFASIRTGKSTITSVDRHSKPSSKERHQQ